ncbi:MAG: ThuA domain-containing protein [Treponema sp.]|jgi:trehalose utilization protein|nr:ThuA domain-containing protein [Treponema sp.]
MGIKVTIWNEYLHEKNEERIEKVYPKGIHGAIQDELSHDKNLSIRTATLEMPGHGLSDEILLDTDVLIWWGHQAHDRVSDETADMVARHVRLGMGLIVLHSGHYSKPFKKLMGTSCSLSWREIGETERIWIIDPAHPVCQGLGPFFELEHEEMYGEVFDIPVPDELLMIGWYKGGEVFRSGCIFKRGRGKVFYFQPGHEEFPTFHCPEVVRVLLNAVYYLKPLSRKEDPGIDVLASPCVDPAEPGILDLYKVNEKPSEIYRKMKERYLCSS